MTDLITEARELCKYSEKIVNQLHTERLDYELEYMPLIETIQITSELCDALEKAEEKNKQLLHEVCKLACESVKRDVALARLEAEVGVALGKGCDYCGLIYAIHAESYGIEDLDCANEPIDNKFCPMYGRSLKGG